MATEKSWEALLHETAQQTHDGTERAGVASEALGAATIGGNISLY